MKYQCKAIKHTDAQYSYVSTKCVQLDDQMKSHLMVSKMQ